MEENSCKFVGDFLTPNGRKFVQKQIEVLKKSLKEVTRFKKEGGDSTKESQETEMSHMMEINVIKGQIIDYERKLKLPEIKVREQKKECLPGNGVKIKLNGKSVFVVIDGVCICKHILPEDHAIISANSPLGKSLIGKKVDESGSYQVVDGKKGKNFTFTVERIDLPSKSKWVFKYDDKLARLSNQIETAEPVLS